MLSVHMSAVSVLHVAESYRVCDPTTSGTKAPVSEQEIAGCQADACAVMWYYLPRQPK